MIYFDLTIIPENSVQKERKRNTVVVTFNNIIYCEHNKIGNIMYELLALA